MIVDNLNLHRYIYIKIKSLTLTWLHLFHTTTIFGVFIALRDFEIKPSFKPWKCKAKLILSYVKKNL